MNTIILEKKVLRDVKGPGINDIISDVFRFPEKKNYYAVIIISGSAFTDHSANTLKYSIYINKQNIGHLEQHHNSRRSHMAFPTFFRGNIIFAGERDYQLTLKRDASSHAQSDANDNWNASIYFLEKPPFKDIEFENPIKLI